MNKVDQEVKRCMLGFHSIFPSRLSVLHHLFCVNGNGYRWVEGDDGAVIESVDVEMSAPEVEAIPSAREDSPGLYLEREYHNEAQMNALRVSADFSDIIRQFISENIDVMCTKSFSYRGCCNMDHIRLYQMTSGYCLMDRAPDDIDPDWRAALLEMAYKVCQMIRSEHLFLGDDSSVLQPSARSTYEIAKKAIDRFGRKR